MPEHPSKPVVLCISGQDPSGGAGIQADIETLAAHGCHAASLISCLTVQDSSHVSQIHPVQPQVILDQARAIIADYKISAIKTGLVGSREVADCILQIRALLPDIPLVLDTILASGGGQTMSAADHLLPLIPLSTLITPNRHEARILGRRNAAQDCAASLLDLGCQAVLITGADESSHGQVTNTLYSQAHTRHWQWPKLPGSYHGSGCTLASAIAAQLARGQSLIEAVDQAQRYTQASLEQAFRPGHGQFIPGRIDP